jgi:hypothetical protein
MAVYTRDSLIIIKCKGKAHSKQKRMNGQGLGVEAIYKIKEYRSLTQEIKKKIVKLKKYRYMRVIFKRDLKMERESINGEQINQSIRDIFKMDS